MSKLFIKDSTLTAIGDAIREKTGTSDLIAPQDMAEKINNLSASGTSASSSYFITPLKSIVLTYLFKIIDLSWFDLTGFTSVNSMFANCENVERFVGELDTSNITNFYGMFHNCKTLKELPVLNTSKGMRFSYMFHNCEGLTEIKGLNTSQGTNFDSMFGACSSLETIKDLNISNALNSSALSRIFFSCRKLKNINFIGTIPYSISFSVSSLLTDESIANIIEYLATVSETQTITFASEVKAKLTDEQRATIEAKGWTLG